MNNNYKKFFSCFLYKYINFKLRKKIIKIIFLINHNK